MSQSGRASACVCAATNQLGSVCRLFFACFFVLGVFKRPGDGVVGGETHLDGTGGAPVRATGGPSKGAQKVVEAMWGSS